MPPQRPVTIIRPPSGWPGPNLPELLRFRELFAIFVWRDLKVRYKQTLLGVAWAVLQPLVTMVIFALFFGRLIKVPTDGIPYPIFVFSGLLFWNYFSQSVTTASNSLVDNEGMIKKIYFPRLILPWSASLTPLADFCIGFLVLVTLGFFYGFHPHLIGILLMPVLALVAIMTVVGLGSFLAAINVRFRDVRYIVPFFIQTLLFLTPVIYPVSIIPTKWQWVLYLNPMTGIITTGRAALLGKGPIPWTGLGVAAIIALAFLLIGTAVFRRTEHQFADIA